MSVYATLFALFAVVLGFAGCEHQRAEHYKAAYAQRSAEIEAEVARRRVEVSEWVNEASRRQEALGKKVEAGQVEIRTVTQQITKEVPVYVTALADSRNWVTLGFVRIHDAAALGKALPESTAELVDSPSGVTPSAVAETVIENYGTCRTALEVVKGWQEWYLTESENWKAKP